MSILAALSEAPPRTLQSTSIVASSPLSTSVRAMIEARQLGRAYDARALDLEAVRDQLPGLAPPAGEVPFLADDSSLEALSLSIDALLAHRRSLIAPSIDRAQPRRHVLVLGAGPGGLMAAIQLRLRDHLVVVCEQREVYTRNRFIGVYKDVAHGMAALGMPERMTYDFSHYRGKRGIMLADIQTFLHAVALKLGVIVYTGAVARELDVQGLRAGEVALTRSDRGGSSSSIGITRWHHDTVARVRSGVIIRFDTIVEATGGRSGMRELVVGAGNVVSLRELGRAAAARDPSLRSFFNDPEDHCAEFVESDYGCPPELFDDFARAVQAEDDAAASPIPDELPCFVSNIDASIFNQPIRASGRAAGVAARVGNVELNIPPSWVVVECPEVDQTLSRYQIEGPLPRTFEFGGERLLTRDHLDRLDPVSLLFRILYAMGVPFDAVDRRKLIDFYSVESSRADASDVVATWVGRFRGLRVGGEQPLVWGTVPGSGASGVEYGIVGEALQNAWYRFGVGVDDTFASALRFAESLELAPAHRVESARRLERVMLARSVQVLYHLYAVAKEVDQGVVGPVLTEYYLAERHGHALCESRLREEARRAVEIATAEADVSAAPRAALLAAALAYRGETVWTRVLALLGSLGYDAQLLGRASRHDAGGLEALAAALSPPHRALLAPLFQRSRGEGIAHDERLCDLAIGRYAWATPWVRACAVRALDPEAPGAADTLARVQADPDPLVAETARAIHTTAGEYLTIDKVGLLKDVSIFSAVPHEILARVAALLGERRAAPEDPIFHEGDPGDCLYVIASGSVRVHQGERTLRRLGPRQFFGELALLDAAPRSASVSALEPTHLFRVDQGDFYALLAEEPRIVHGINRALCKMLRQGPG